MNKPKKAPDYFLNAVDPSTEFQDWQDLQFTDQQVFDIVDDQIDDGALPYYGTG